MLHPSRVPGPATSQSFDVSVAQVRDVQMQRQIDEFVESDVAEYLDTDSLEINESGMGTVTVSYPFIADGHRFNQGESALVHFDPRGPRLSPAE